MSGQRCGATSSTRAGRRWVCTGEAGHQPAEAHWWEAEGRHDPAQLTIDDALDSCADCGELGELTGHMECRYPGRVSQ